MGFEPKPTTLLTNLGSKKCLQHYYLEIPFITITFYTDQNYKTFAAWQAEKRGIKLTN